MSRPLQVLCFVLTLILCLGALVIRSVDTQNIEVSDTASPAMVMLYDPGGAILIENTFESIAPASVVVGLLAMSLFFCLNFRKEVRAAGLSAAVYRRNPVSRFSRGRRDFGFRRRLRTI